MTVLDEDGYPTDEVLEAIANYSHKDDRRALLDLIQSAWRYEDRFRIERGKLYLSTGGWSGNEEVVAALRRSDFWLLAWEQSRRGGHYVFDLGRWMNP